MLIRSVPFMALLLVFGWSAGAQAGPLSLRPGMTGVPDLGALQCKTFNTMYPYGPTGMRQSALTWAEGYLHARSGLTIDEILRQQANEDRTWDFDSLSGLIVDYCAANPEAPFPNAVKDLAKALGIG